MVFNDHFFKWQFSNWFTGKLSDFMGMIILPLFIVYLFPKWQKASIIITFLFFIYWKSPYSQVFIDFYNQYSPIQITRIVDYTDFLAFSILPFTYYLIKNINGWENLKIKKVNPIFVLVPTVFSLLSTSPPLRLNFIRYDEAENKFQVKMNKEELLEQIRKEGINFKKINCEKWVGVDLTHYLVENWIHIKSDSLNYEKVRESAIQNCCKDKTKEYYIIEDFRIDEKKHIGNVYFSIDEVKTGYIDVHFKGVEREDVNISNYRRYKRYCKRKMNKKLVPKFKGE